MSDPKPELELNPALVEEAVLLATDASESELRRRYRNERDTLYQIEDLDEREMAFQALDGRWFAQLGLGLPLLNLLGEFASVWPRVSGCSVLPARRTQEEGADLHRARRAAPVLVVKLTPASLIRFERVSRLLRSELLHVEDMLDPEFGYQHELPTVDGGTTYENLLRSRYRVLWNTTVDGRLAARGQLSKEEESRRREEFLGAFPMLAPLGEHHFNRFFHGGRPRHHDILAFAMDSGGKGAGRCSLCELPTASFHSDPQTLATVVQETIRKEFADWNPSRGICRQCADLYQARVSGDALFSRQMRFD